MLLEWSAFAFADRTAIFDYIEADSPRAAVAVDDRIQACVENLTRFPEMGRPGRIEGTRELVISRTPYIAAYRIAGDTVRILRVLHGAQQWPDEMPDEPLVQLERFWK
jgi:toxin ParE1/3/4